jgi:hypothetical protein
MQSMMKLHEFVDVFLTRSIPRLMRRRPTNNNNKNNENDGGGGSIGRSSVASDETPSQAWHRGQLAEQFPALKEEYRIPVYAETSTASIQDKLFQTNVLWGAADTPTLLHRDPFHTLLAQAVGYQYVRVYPADQTSFLYPHPDPFSRNLSLIRSSELHRSSGPSLLSNFPLLAQASYMECILKPGEILYIPQGCWYFGSTLCYSLSMSFWFTHNKPQR